MDMAMYPRFMSSFLSNAIFLLVFVVLWLSSRSTLWSIKLLGLGLFVGGGFLGAKLAHSSFISFSYFMSSVPFVLTIWTIGWLVSQSKSLAIQRAGLAAAILFPFGYFDLIRWNGLYGGLQSENSWRWTQTAEERFLEARRENAQREAGRGAKPGAPRPWTVQGGDWTEFRGPRREGATRAGEPFHWEKGSPEKLWRHPVGPAWSSVIVVDGFLVTQEQRGDLEAVVCYEAASGQEAWVYEYPTRFTEGISGAGPRATPTFYQGRLYALGAKGRLSCLEPETGKLLWSREIAEEAKATVPIWGYSASPLVMEGKVIVFAGGEPGKSVLAYEAESGRPAWAQGGGPQSYSSVQRVTLGGRDQIVMQDNKRIAGLAPSDGKILWERPTATEALIPMLQPHALGGDQLLINWGTGMALLEVKGRESQWSVAESWSCNRLKPSFNDFVVHGDYVYGLDDGVLTCLDTAHGERKWRRGRYGYGQLLLLADQGTILVLSEKGEVLLVPAKPEESEALGRFQAIEGKTWNHPVIAEGCLFVRNPVEMACYRLHPVRSP
jgi:outer membrane protein assembly factor BamB